MLLTLERYCENKILVGRAAEVVLCAKGLMAFALAKKSDHYNAADECRLPRTIPTRYDLA
jgi:hypothetical protein